MEPRRTGKTAVLIVIGAFLLVSSTTFLRPVEAPEIVRVLLTCVLCWFLYKGKNWARWVFGVLVGLAVAFSIFAMLTIPMLPIGYILLLVLNLIFVVSVVALFSPRYGGPYFDADAT